MVRNAMAEPLSPEVHPTDVSSLLPAVGYLRLHQIIGRPARRGRPAIPPLIPVSRSTWWAGVKSGRYPQPTRSLGERITAWRIEDIRELLDVDASSRPDRAQEEAARLTQTSEVDHTKQDGDQLAGVPINSRVRPKAAT